MTPSKQGSYNYMPTNPDYKLPGAMIVRMMRKRKLTIRFLANKFGITMKRVREVRNKGVTGLAANEWHFMITGVWLDDIGVAGVSTN